MASGIELINYLDIPIEQVEVIFVNGKAFVPKEANIKPGDCVAAAWYSEALQSSAWLRKNIIICG